MLKRVGSLPEPSRASRPGYIDGDVREFCRNKTFDVAEVSHEGKTAKSVVSAARHYIRTHPGQCAGVGATLRGGKVYLYRKGVGE